ncbi:unnamed protein product [Gongylonema pulchrum]|uniref:Ferrochelatase n=1 Tax=Gongylonema pulchrum TaxID=637853 RepID=A0A183EMZ8_9BILA|nr:unnamed protein product [Gongylonema pulchrum]
MIGTYAEILRDYLNVLIPEHRPFHCTYAYLYEEPAIPKTIADLIKMGMEQLILLPLYPHYSCFRTGTMLNTAVEALDEQTLPLAKDGINVMDHRVRPMSHISFRCSTIDRWSTHPALINFWHDLLFSELEKHDSLLFVAPQMGVDLLSPPDYSRILAHGFAELIKNHLMGRRASARLSCRCRFCFSSRCSLRKAMLLPEKIHSNNRSFEGKKLTEEVMKQQQITA